MMRLNDNSGVLRRLRANYLRAVLAAGTACVGLAMAGMAEQATAQTAQATSFDIPPGPLSGALAAFGRQAGLQITYLPEIASGKRSSGVSGHIGAGQALARLLQGSGLTWRFTNARTVAIERPGAATSGGAAPAGAIALDTIDVEGVPSSDPGRTEGINSYKPGVTATATKFQLTPRETPQTVTVVTNQQMRDFNMTSVDDALKTVSGVFVQERGENGASYYSRGFDMQSQFDGVPNPIGIST
ncbi:STN domain-containing protein, partial [Nitrobacter winogradskyi]